MSPRQVGSLAVLLLAFSIVQSAGGEPLPPVKDLPATEKAPRTDSYGDPLPPGVLARMGTVRFRPGSQPFSLALSPDGRTLATGEDGVVRFWDLATGKETRSFSYPDFFWVRCVTFSPDGKRLAVVGDHRDSMQWQPFDHSLFVCEADTGRILYQFREDAGGFRLPWFSPDGKLLVAGQGGHGKLTRPLRLVFWKADTGKEVRALDDLGWWAWSPDGKILAGVKLRFDGIHLWDVATGKELHRLPGLDAPAVALAFSPDGKTLAAANYGGPGAPKEKKPDTAVHLWDVATGKERLQIAGQCDGLDLLISPDGATLAARDPEGGVALWEVGTGKPRQRVGSGKEDRASSFLFSPDGKRLLWGSAGTLHEWDVVAGKETRRLGEALGGIDQILITPDGKRLACGGDGLSVWDLTTGKELGPAGGHRAGVGTMLFSPDGRALASVDHALALGLWDVATGKPLIPSLDGRGLRSVGLSFAPDGSVLTALGIDATARSWDLTTGRVAREFSVGGEATRRTWRRLARDDLPPYPDQRLDEFAAFSPDGRTLAVPGEGRAVQFWDAVTGKPLGRLEHSAPVLMMAFSPGGRYLATQDAEYAIHLWDAQTGKEQREWLSRGNDGGFFFSPDGKFLGWGEDRRIRLRDLATGKEAAPLEGQLNARCNVVFLRGGQVLACWDRDDKLRLYDVSSGALMRTLAGGTPGGRESILIARPDGRALAYVPVELHRPVYSLRDAPTGREICQTKGWLDRFAISPDGRVLAQGGSGLVFRELATGAVVGQVAEAHRGRVKTLRFSPDGRTLASAGWDSTILIWDYAAAVGLAAPGRPLAATDLEAAWSDLAGKDAARAYKAIGALAGSADKSVPFLRERLRPTSAKDQEAIRRWVADFDSDDFDAREKATRELAKLGWEAEPALLDALIASPSPEARVRIERVLAGTAMDEWPSEALRKARAVCALERIGTSAAREFLEQLAKGAAEARLTQEAKASLGRLGRRAAAAP